jgi:hypothetical protein
VSTPSKLCSSGIRQMLVKSFKPENFCRTTNLLLSCVPQYTSVLHVKYTKLVFRATTTSDTRLGALNQPLSLNTCSLVCTVGLATIGGVEVGGAAVLVMWSGVSTRGDDDAVVAVSSRYDDDAVVAVSTRCDGDAAVAVSTRDDDDAVVAVSTRDDDDAVVAVLTGVPLVDSSVCVGAYKVAFDVGAGSPD